MIGILLYLTASRSDIMFSVCLCTRFQEDPKTSHLEAIKRIFRYVMGTRHLGLWYPKGTGIETIVYADFDHVGYYVDHKSTSSVCTFMGCCLTLRFSKKQTALGISTTEAEYVSIEKACQQALLIKQALVDYDIKLDDIPVLCDNKGAIDLSDSGNGVEQERSIPIILKKWAPPSNLLNGDVTSVPIWVKLYDIPILAFTADGLNAMATKLGNSIMLDSYTSLCEMVIAIPNVEDDGVVFHSVRVDYEWKSPRCGINIRADDEGFIEVKKKKSGGNNGGTKNFTISVKPKTQYRPKASTSGYNKKSLGNKGNTFSLSNSFEALNDENLIIKELASGSMATTSGTEDNGVDDYDSYDDDMYPDNIQTICDKLDIRRTGGLDKGEIILARHLITVAAMADVSFLFDCSSACASYDVKLCLVMVLEDIECKDSYDSNLDESTFLVTPLSDSNEDEYFTPSDDVELLLHRDPSTPIMSVVSILEGFTDEPPLEENDDLYDLESKKNDWKKTFYDTPIDDLMTEDKVFDLGIHDQIISQHM
uniref:Uncharacterized mitochondrial protein AtMg00810-like n=1 Tax=Tanacetum cinerariifolium TaxID=118510 RepID=A0A6L2K098_TANCI|nr:uncharacterized mitochondrial protein AtMg00810-like [Tanacetum cinerariifolium]